ncbi:MAG TPA: Rne/Rng family ribonuclease [Candidatus Angelobacter sp.]|jgi:ribonuclease G|nr:Rne/Rng family ribonuclease [Candidatus Angelobacter sp.]
MSKELFVCSTPHETKVAIVEEDQLTEVYFERENEYTLAGSIYKGRVTRVLPGMQSAFVNVGLERDAFLYVSDFLLDEDEDAETLEHVVPRPYVMASGSEPRTEGATEPIEAETVVPSFTGEAEDAEAGPNGAQQRDVEREGQRRWKGRRRRGRGRDRFPDRDQDRSHAHSEQPQREQDHGEHDQTEVHAESKQHEPDVVEQHPAETAPEPHPPETFREARPQTFSPRQAVVLPGESISKYQPQSAAPAASTPAPVKPKPSQSAGRPSTEYSFDPKRFSPNSMVLPGESLAKYRDTPTPEAIPVAGQSAPLQAEHSELVQPEVHAQEASEPEAAASSPSIDVPSVVAETRAAIKEDLGPQGGIVSVVEEREEAIQHKPAEDVDVPSAFEGAAVEPQDIQEQAAPDKSRLQAMPPAGVTGSGVMEEEEIEEEESEFPSFQEQFDLDDFEDLEVAELEEQEMDLVPLGSEFTEAVRDAHTAEIVTGQYEPEGLGAGEEFEEAAETMGQVSDGEDEEDIDLHAELSGDVEEGSAEMRAPVPTAGYQQRTDRRGERRGPGRKPGGRRMRGRPRPHAQRTFPAITDLLKEGQEILVQIAKEPIAKKGARITSHIALPGRFLVYMPTVHHTGVSRKIASEEERQRLKRIVLSERGEAHGGFIVRTAAAAATEDDLRADIRFLINLWNEIRNRAEAAKAPALIYHDLNLVERILRDQVTTSFSAIWVDSEQEYERILRFVSRFQSSLVKRVKLYTKETPLFEQFSISEEINKALKSKVWLKSGGYIVINQTEALVAVDINTGKYVGKTARLEDTIVKTNIDAIKEIVRQIRLRDLGGIIVIDFIDMDERKNRQRVMQALEEALKADRAPSKVLQFNDFGLVAITRKRVKQSLERTLGQQCTTCTGTGMIKSVTTVCNEIYVEMRKMARRFEHDIVLRVHPDVAKALKLTNSRWIEEMEELTKRTVLVKSDPLLHPEQFDLQ